MKSQMYVLNTFLNIGMNLNDGDRFPKLNLGVPNNNKKLCGKASQNRW